MAPSGFRTRRHSASQARQNASYSAKSWNLSQSSSTPSTLRIVRPHQIAGKLQIVGRVGEDEIDAGVRKLLQLSDAVTDKNFPALRAALATTQYHELYLLTLRSHRLRHREHMRDEPTIFVHDAKRVWICAEGRQIFIFFDSMCNSTCGSSAFWGDGKRAG